MFKVQDPVDGQCMILKLYRKRMMMLQKWSNNTKASNTTTTADKVRINGKQTKTTKMCGLAAKNALVPLLIKQNGLKTNLYRFF